MYATKHTHHSQTMDVANTVSEGWKERKKERKRKKDRVTNEGRTVGRKDTNEERKHTSKQEGNI